MVLIIMDDDADPLLTSQDNPYNNQPTIVFQIDLDISDV
jgi:hypothetical protein